MTEPRTRGFRRQHWPEAVYDAAERLLIPDATGATRSARAIADELAKQFEKSPEERTILDWIKSGRIRATDPNQIWSLATAESGEPAAVLPALAALDQRHRGVKKLHGIDVGVAMVRKDEARVLVRMAEVVPRLRPLERLDLTRRYLERTRAGMRTDQLDRFMAHVVHYRAWTDEGWRALEDALVEGDMEFPPPNLFPLPPSELMGVIEKAKTRRRAAAEVES